MKRVALTVGLTVVLSGCNGYSIDSGPTTSAVSTTTTALSTTTTTQPTTTTTNPPLSVAGKVLGPDGAPVANAIVVLGEVTTTTGSDGFFDLVSPGPGTVVVTRPGWTTDRYEWDHQSSFASLSIEPLIIRGIRVSADAAGDQGVFDELLALAQDTAVNALVFDTKQEGGTVLYETTVEQAHEIGAVKVTYDASQRLEEVDAAGLYAITRIVVFEDAFLANARPEEKLAGRWVDPRSEVARDYNIALAVEACAMGFDEIQFDYVRFPAGRTAEVSGQLQMTQEERVSAIEAFLGAARSSLEPLGCAISADIFAIVVSALDDQGLGQRPEELSRHIHALSPMVYPSHYSLGWLGFADPNDYPYEVTADAIDDAMARIEPGTVLRPWLQAFWWSNSQIRSAIQAAEDRGVGWLLWNIRSNFDREAIPTDAELNRSG